MIPCFVDSASHNAMAQSLKTDEALEIERCRHTQRCHACKKEVTKSVLKFRMHLIKQHFLYMMRIDMFSSLHRSYIIP